MKRQELVELIASHLQRLDTNGSDNYEDDAEFLLSDLEHKNVIKVEDWTIVCSSCGGSGEVDCCDNPRCLELLKCEDCKGVGRKKPSGLDQKRFKMLKKLLETS